MNKQNVNPLIVASFNAQSVKGNDMACKRFEISTFIKDNGVDLFLCLKHGLVHNVTKRKLLNYHQVDLRSIHCHVNRDLVAVGLLQYTNLFYAPTSHSKQTLILLTHRST